MWVFVELVAHALEDAFGGSVGIVGAFAEAGGAGEKHNFLAAGGGALQGKKAAHGAGEDGVGFG